MQDKELMSLAIKARNASWSPYSNYAVGAALLSKSGKVYTGCNIENAAYSATCCAERTALFKAVSQGEHDFEVIAIAGGKSGQPPQDNVFPCGICRQVMAEFCNENFRILVLNAQQDIVAYSFEELLPHSFSGKNLFDNN